ncbi:hypothetical protein D3C87_1116050 [compost metagenome]
MALQANQLLFQQRQGLRHPDQYPVEWAGDRFAGWHVRQRIKRLAITDKVLFQPLKRQEGIAAAGHVDLAGQTGGQCAKTVVEHQNPCLGRGLLFGQMVEQVLVRRIEGLQRFVLLFGLADEVEAGERCFEQRHGAGSG